MIVSRQSLMSLASRVARVFIADTANVADNAVTNAKLADMAQGTVKGRSSSGSGDPEDVAIVAASGSLLAGRAAGDIAFLAPSLGRSYFWVATTAGDVLATTFAGTNFPGTNLVEGAGTGATRTTRIMSTTVLLGGCLNRSTSSSTGSTSTLPRQRS